MLCQSSFTDCNECIINVFRVDVGSAGKKMLAVQENACNAADLGSISESGRSPGGGNGNPLQ